MDSKRKFRFKLAVHLGYKTVRELEQCMTIKEFNEWYNYAQDEPLLADRLEMMLAQVISTASGESPVKHMVSISKEDKEKQAQKELNAKIANSIKGL